MLTYALRALLDAGVMDRLAFKGGTCLRKLVFGSVGRFSEDLEFTLDTDTPDKVRDLYDLQRFSVTPFDGELLRQLAVLKLWQARDRFDPDVFFRKLRSDNFDWVDIERLVRTSERIEPEEIISTVESRFDFLRQLAELEQQVVADAKSGWNKPLANRLRFEIFRRFVQEE